MKTIAFATIVLLGSLATAQAEGGGAYGRGTERDIDVAKQPAAPKSAFTLQLGPVRSAAPGAAHEGGGTIESSGTRRDLVR